MFPELSSYLAQYGIVRILAPDEYREVDLLVLYSDKDIDTTSYSAYHGNIPFPTFRGVDPILDVFAKDMLQAYIGTPILGIETGALILNALNKGKLIFNYSNSLDYHDLIVDTPLTSIRNIQLVNSKISQIPKKGTSGLTPIAFDKDAMFAFIGQKQAGVMWNPFKANDKGLTESLIKYFLPIANGDNDNEGAVPIPSITIK